VQGSRGKARARVSETQSKQKGGKSSRQQSAAIREQEQRKSERSKSFVDIIALPAARS
jgi:hypothetical protein